MQKKELKRNRIVHYFVDAAIDIINEEGIKSVTIRKIADRAGYNSATLYNYFENLDHLVLFAAMRLIRSYTNELTIYMEKGQNSLEKNLLVWELFLEYSFKEPEIFEAIFCADLHKSMDNYVDEYYALYPEDLPNGDEQILQMLSKYDIYDRTYILLRSCAEEGFFREEDIISIDEMSILIYKGMLSTFLHKEEKSSPEEYKERTMRYIRICYKGFLTEEKRDTHL